MHIYIYWIYFSSLRTTYTFYYSYFFLFRSSLISYVVYSWFSSLSSPILIVLFSFLVSRSLSLIYHRWIYIRRAFCLPLSWESSTMHLRQIILPIYVVIFVISVSCIGPSISLPHPHSPLFFYIISYQLPVKLFIVFFFCYYYCFSNAPPHFVFFLGWFYFGIYLFRATSTLLSFSQLTAESGLFQAIVKSMYFDCIHSTCHPP